MLANFATQSTLPTGLFLMEPNQPVRERPEFNFRDAYRFWEPRRIWYNAILTLAVLLWVLFTWPHFRPALNLVAFGKLLVLAGLANVCYCAGYVAEFFMQPALPPSFWRRTRLTLWLAGILIALVMENYCIADEIYPDIARNAVVLGE